MTFLIILILLVVLWPWIVKWTKGFISRRAEDTIRRIMGMPSRKEEKRRRKQTEKQQAAASARNQRKAEGEQREADRQAALRSMKENAVDVEYTEYKEFSQTEIAIEDGKGNTTVYTESQVSDVEFVEIKESKNDRK